MERDKYLSFKFENNLMAFILLKEQYSIPQNLTLSA